MNKTQNVCKNFYYVLFVAIFISVQKGSLQKKTYIHIKENMFKA